MGVSAFKLIAAGSDGKSIRTTLVVPDHGFVAGDVIRYQVTPGGGFEGWSKAIATSPFEAEVAGIVESATQNEFVIVYGGEISLVQMVDLPTSGEDVYFLSAEEAGKLSTNPPISGGHVIKPVLTRISADVGLVTNYVGTVIGGRATVSLDSVQPVGTIMQYAGQPDLLPDSWQVCDGALLSRTEFSELYDKIGIVYGSEQTVTVDSVGPIAAGWTALQGSLSGTVVSASGSNIVIRPQSVNIDGTATNQKFLAAVPITFTFLTSTQVKTPVSASVTAFNKPNISARTVFGTGTGVNIGSKALGQIGGIEDLTLSLSQLPSGIPYLVSDAQGSYRIDEVDDGNAEITPSQTSQNNLPPFISLYYIIKISSYAKASYIDGLDLNISMGGLTDVQDEIFTAGDILIYDGSTSLWKDSQLFSDWINEPNLRFHGAWTGFSPFAGEGSGFISAPKNAITLGYTNKPFHYNSVLSIGGNSNIELRNGSKITDAVASYDAGAGPWPQNTIDLSYNGGSLGFINSVLIQSKQGIHNIIDTNDSAQFGTLGHTQDDGIFTIGRGGFGSGITGADYLEILRVSSNGRAGLVFDTDIIGSTTWYNNAIRTGLGVSGGLMLRRGSIVDGITNDISNFDFRLPTSDINSGRYDIPTSFAVKKYVDERTINIQTVTVEILLNTSNPNNIVTNLGYRPGLMFCRASGVVTANSDGVNFITPNVSRTTISSADSGEVTVFVVQRTGDDFFFLWIVVEKTETGFILRRRRPTNREVDLANGGDGSVSRPNDPNGGGGGIDGWDGGDNGRITVVFDIFKS